MMYKDIWDEIKHKVHLIDEMEKHGIKLSPSGNRYKCVCPFHNDTDPSMCVNVVDEVETFKCFSCQVKGSVVDFIMRFRNYNLKQALEYFTDKNNGYVFEWTQDVNIQSVLNCKERPARKKRRNSDNYNIYEFLLFPLSVELNRFIGKNEDKYKQILPFLKEINDYCYFNNNEYVEYTVSRLRSFMPLVDSHYNSFECEKEKCLNTLGS